MDLEILKKKISSYRSDGGKVKNVSDEVLMEILSAWEHWTGPARGFATAIGMNRNSLPKLIGKAKRLRREGHFESSEFKEVKIADVDSASSALPCLGVEVTWSQGKIIRFPGVDELIDFLKKVA